MSRIYQGIMPAGLVKELERLKLPQRTLAELSDGDLSESTLSMFINGRRGLSLQVQETVFEILRFCRELQTTSHVPVDFGNTAAIKKLWGEFRTASSADAVVRGAKEIRAAGETT